MRRRLARREQLVRSRSRAKNEIHAVLMRRLKGKPPVSDLFGVKGRKWLSRARAAARGGRDGPERAAPRRVPGRRDRRGRAADRARGAALGRDARRLMTVPGRQRDLRRDVPGRDRRHPPLSHVAALVGYLGLDPRVRQSGSEPAKGGRISKRGSASARWALVEAAWSVVQQPGPLHAFYERIRARRGHGKAIVAVARKLAALFWCLLSRGEDYAHQQPSLTAKKLRPARDHRRRPDAEGQARPASGPPASGCATAERELAQQAEASYTRWSPTGKRPARGPVRCAPPSRPGRCTRRAGRARRRTRGRPRAAPPPSRNRVSRGSRPRGCSRRPPRGAPAPRRARAPGCAAASRGPRPTRGPARPSPRCRSPRRAPPSRPGAPPDRLPAGPTRGPRRGRPPSWSSSRAGPYASASSRPGVRVSRISMAVSVSSLDARAVALVPGEHPERAVGVALPQPVPRRRVDLEREGLGVDGLLDHATQEALLGPPFEQRRPRRRLEAARVPQRGGKWAAASRWAPSRAARSPAAWECSSTPAPSPAARRDARAAPARHARQGRQRRPMQGDAAGRAEARPRSSRARSRGGSRPRRRSARSIPDARHASSSGSSSARDPLQQPDLRARSRHGHGLQQPRARERAGVPRGQARRRARCRACRRRGAPAPRSRRTGCRPCGRAARRRRRRAPRPAARRRPPTAAPASPDGPPPSSPSTMRSGCSRPSSSSR